jgi:uncharacterized membrane protein YukC
MKKPKPRPSYDNPYEEQRVKFWARKIRTLTPVELDKLIIELKPEEIILEKAREVEDKPFTEKAIEDL